MNCASRSEGGVPRNTVQVIHRKTAELARDDSFLGRLHRELKHHALGIVTDDTVPRERHVKSPL
jgi:hypothetical protein